MKASHQQLINALVKAEGLKTKHFMVNVLDEIRKDESKEWYDEESIQDVKDKGKIVPDAYKVDGDIISIYEVECSNPISKNKMIKLINLFWALDAASFYLRLFIVNRFGHISECVIREVEHEIFFNSLTND